MTIVRVRTTMSAGDSGQQGECFIEPNNKGLPAARRYFLSIVIYG